jgi:hypothetical protein
MSSLYEENTWLRSDWGDIQTLLEKGESVNIRPATEAEVGHAHKMLEDVNKQMDAIYAK